MRTLRALARRAYVCFAVAVLMMAAVAVLAARELGEMGLRRAVQQSVKLNSADRDRNTNLILKRLKAIEDKLGGGTGSDTIPSFREVRR